MSDDKKGMLRHVDVLGRVVIPSEVRKALRINYGDLLEFCACSDNQVVMRKFHLIADVVPMCKQMIEIALLNRDCQIVIFDTEKVLTVNGEQNKNWGKITDEILDKLQNRKMQNLENVTLSNSLKLSGNVVFLPIVCDGDVLGGVAVSGEKETREDCEKIATSLASFLSNYFE